MFTADHTYDRPNTTAEACHPLLGKRNMQPCWCLSARKAPR